MMWLVNASLRHPFSVYVGMLIVGVLGVVSYQRTPTDILPQLKVPVVVIYASYRGMPAPDMEQGVTSVLERALTRCDHLVRIESRSILGAGIIRVYFRSEVNPDVATSQVISLVQTEMQNMPPGMLPPTIIKYDASAIPVGNLIVSSHSRSDRDLLDLTDTFLREELAGIEGLASAPVFGGVLRQVQVQVDPIKLQAHDLSPMEVARIVNTQSQILPTGEARFGPQTYYIGSNSLVKTVAEFEQIPIKSAGAQVVRLGDVASVIDGQRWRTNTVLVDGRRAVYMPLLRQSGASAVSVVDNVQAFIPKLHQRGLPEDVRVEVAFDQAQYVRDALTNLRMEGLYGAVFASLVVLLFLGNLRSTWIVALSIPLSVLAAFAGLYYLGHTLNIMTLGGIALVLGRVVDDSIVTVENTVRHLHMGKSPEQAARDSAVEIGGPVLMATLTTVVVFFPITFMAGMGKYLFTPLAVSATLAMLASYVVSRSVSPMYCAKYLRAEDERHRDRFPWWLFTAGLIASTGLLVPTLALWAWGAMPWWLERTLGWAVINVSVQIHQLAVGIGALGLIVAAIGLLYWVSPLFQRFFEGVAASYEWLLRRLMRVRYLVLAATLAAVLPTMWLFGRVGQELFPDVDSGEFTVHMRATGGPRVEVTEEQVREVERIVREEVGEEDLDLTLSNIGVNARWSAIYTPNNGPHAAFVRVQLRPGFGGRTTSAATYVGRIRERLAREFPGDDFFYETGGMIRRILNSDAIAPIEVLVHGRDVNLRRTLTRQLDNRLARIHGVQDTYMPQGMDLPQYRVNVDRTTAQLLGFTETDAIRNVVVTLMSSAQLAPNLWVDPRTGNPYIVGVQYPEHKVRDRLTLEGIPISVDRARADGTRVRARLDQVARLERTQAPAEIYHHNIDRVSQIMVNVGGQDMAGVAAEVERIVGEFPLEYAVSRLPPGRQELVHDPTFRARLREYLRDDDRNVRRRQKAGEAVRTNYGIDPDQLKLPPGFRFTVRGEVSSMRDSFAEMSFALGLAIVLLYLLLAAQFASWRDPLVMLVSAPLGGVGVALILWLTDTSLNIQSFMGVLMMVGIALSNSTLLVDFANQRRREGLGTLDAVVGAARVRLQPIVMTSLATVVGLLPMAIHLHPGDEMNLPLARAVIGGLVASTVLTLFVVPALYVMLKPSGPEPAIQGGGQ